MPTAAQLKAEIQAGPHAATLAPFVTAGNHRAVADFLNDKNGTGAALIVLPNISRQRVLRVFLKAAISLDLETAAKKAKWDRILPFVRDMEDIPAAVLEDVLTLAVTDGLITAAKAENIRKRMGCRCEVVWGENEMVTHADVSLALRSA